VRIDPDAVRSAQRLICIDDCGRVLNPLLVEGQVVSGIAQGLGQALMEQVVFDATVRSSAPRWATTRSAGRGHASLNDLVLARTVTPAPWNPLGVKGVGGRARSAR
jgi:carbon-monoxide dehydrogenase large subunit